MKSVHWIAETRKEALYSTMIMRVSKEDDGFRLFVLSRRNKSNVRNLFNSSPAYLSTITWRAECAFSTLSWSLVRGFGRRFCGKESEVIVGKLFHAFSDRCIIVYGRRVISLSPTYFSPLFLHINSVQNYGPIKKCKKQRLCFAVPCMMYEEEIRGISYFMSLNSEALWLFPRKNVLGPKKKPNMNEPPGE